MKVFIRAIFNLKCQPLENVNKNNNNNNNNRKNKNKKDVKVYAFRKPLVNF